MFHPVTKEIKMKILTRSNPMNIGLAALLAMGLMFVLVQNAKAAGTASNTTISNSATLAYTVAAVPQTDITSAAATFVVDNKVNLTVAKVADANVIPSSTKQALAFTVTNNGNTSQRYALSVTAGAENFTTNIASTSIYLDVNANNAWDVGDTLYTSAADFGDVLADGSLKILIVADITTPNTNGQTAVFNLVATTVTIGGTTVTSATGAPDTPGSVDVVFADVAGSTDAANDGIHAASATYTIASSAITVTKTATLLCDPVTATGANRLNIPGSITRWTITVSNGAGGSDATLTSISDTLAATTTFDTHLSVPDGTPANCVSAVGTAESASGRGFKVTSSVSRNMGGTAGGAAATTSYFTSANDADGVELNAGVVTATFATILPVDGGHASAGLLKANESVSIIFNITVN